MKKKAVVVLALFALGMGGAFVSTRAHADPNCHHSHSRKCSSTTTTSAASSAVCGSLAGQTPSTTYSHVIWIWMENKAYSDVIGSASAPYENQLAASCGLATNYFGITHPSLPNYIAATSGSPQGIADDNPPASHPLSLLSLFGQVSSGSYEESMPANCSLGDTYPYAVKHNPEAYYLSLRTQCQAQDVPLVQFDPHNLPQFSFITPNLCSDTHDCSVDTGDAWLRQFLPPIFASADYRSGRTVVFLTWDEDDSSSGNHVPLIEMSAHTAPGTRTCARFDHYSLLKTTEELLGVTSDLGAAANATSMRTAFGL